MYLWFFAAIIAYFVKGLCGFASTLVFTSVLSFGTVNVNIAKRSQSVKNSDVDCWYSGRTTLLGMFAGIMCSNKIEEKRVKKIMSVLLIVSGISLILKTY